MNFDLKSFARSAVCVLAAALCLAACSPLPETRLRDSNRLRTVYRGMTKAEFLRVMGTELMFVYRPDGHIRQVIQNPYKTEAFAKGDVEYEIVTYFVNPRPKDGPVTPDELFPYVFFDGKVIGSGQEFVDELRRAAETRGTDLT